MIITISTSSRTSSGFSARHSARRPWISVDGVGIGEERSENGIATPLGISLRAGRSSCTAHRDAAISKHRPVMTRIDFVRTSACSEFFGVAARCFPTYVGGIVNEATPDCDFGVSFHGAKPEIAVLPRITQQFGILSCLRCAVHPGAKLAKAVHGRMFRSIRHCAWTLYGSPELSTRRLGHSYYTQSPKRRVFSAVVYQ